MPLAEKLLVLPFLLVSAAGQTAPSPGAAAQPKDSACSVQGRVVNAATGEPIRKVSLSLIRSGAIGRTQTESGEEGQFVFRNLDPGRYTLIGEKAGLARQAYGARSNPLSGSALILTEGQELKDLVFKLTPGGVVLGHVFDEDGEPVAGAIVALVKPLYQGGEPLLSAMGSAQTNDLGEFRLAGLRAGSYTLFATSRLLTSGIAGGTDKPAGDGPERDYVATYYPSSTDPARAVPIQVAAGAEVGGANIRLAKADTVRVRGKVSGGVEGKQTIVMLVPKANSGSLTRATSGRSSSPKPDGTFEITGVSAGAYTLVAFSEDSSGGGVLFSSREIQVGKEHLAGVMIAVGTPGDLAGAVTIEGAPRADLKNLRVTLAGAPDSPTFSTPGAAVGDGGKFTVKSVPAARYAPQVSGAPENYYVKAVKFGGQDAPETGIALNGTSAGLEITLSPAGAQVEGTVLNGEKEPAKDAVVVLIPDSRRASLYKEMRTDEKGRFNVKGVTPGEYKLLAWEDIETAGYKDPEFLKKFEASAEAVTLNENDHKTVTLKLIPWQP